ncbi:hypothetical protein [Nocardia sp. NPDC050175]|uniref:hypothetical protein n=1 Tax=Nocardia sp. NPDC050175 TaxID=3364317 RepID=UPI0037A7BAAE
MASSTRGPVTLSPRADLTLRPPAPFDFDTTTSKPSTLPDPTTRHEPGTHWQTIRGDGQLPGLRLRADGALYEWVSVLALLQMATAGRLSKMVHAVFDNYGTRVGFDGHELHAFWQTRDIAAAGEEPLRALELGYRAKSLVRIAESMLEGGYDEDAIRAMDRGQARKALLRLYGIGPASVGYLLYQTFHHYDALDTVPPWDVKLYARLLYDTEAADPDRIIADMTARYGRFRALASAYMLEDLFARHQHEPIAWLADEIRT